MALAAHPRKLTADEFFALPDDLPSRTQLIEGELVMSSPSFRHQRIILWLCYLHLGFAQEHADAGEVGTNTDALIDEHNVYNPDLWWVPPERRMDGEANKHLVPPPLVVEVRSPSTWRYDINTKLRHYEAAGVLEVWLVDTGADVVLVFRRSSPDAPSFDVSLELGAGEQLTTPLIAGWSVDLAVLFAR